MMKSNHPKTVGSNPEIVRNHPIHPTGTNPFGILCSSYTHWARGPWGSVAVASCGADLSSHRVSTVTVGFGFISHDATSRSKVVSFGTVRSAARRTVGNTGCNKLSIGRMRGTHFNGGLRSWNLSPSVCMSSSGAIPDSTAPTSYLPSWTSGPRRYPMRKGSCRS